MLNLVFKHSQKYIFWSKQSIFFYTYVKYEIIKVEAGAALSEELGKAKKAEEEAKTKGERIKTLEEELRQVSYS